MAESRTKKTIRNTAFSFVYQLSDVLLNFMLRTIFIHTLGKTYLGLNGLFSNILSVLSFMDLGIGGAIVFCLYRPLADHDYGKVNALMRLYKKAYTIIGSLVCIIGLLLTPFLKYIVKLPDDIPHLYWIYWLTIGNTAISYFLAYRRSLLIADQRMDINVKNQLVFRIIRFALLSAALLTVKNYIVYLLLDVANTFASNVHITWLVKKRYRNIERAEVIPITSEEKQQIAKFVSSGIFSKFGQTIVNCTDSIIISAFVSTIMVGLYSNYSMITTSLDMAVYLLFSGLTASIGNFAVEKNSQEAERLFRRITFGNFFVSSYLCVCMAALINPFVQIWAGNDYLLQNETVIILILNFYISSMQKSIECFMGANGEMYYHNRYRSLVEGLVNLAVSLALVKYTNLGITGVFIGTTVCFLAGRIWMDALVLYKYWFKKIFLSYVVCYAKRALLTLAMAFAGKAVSDVLFRSWGLNIFTWVLCGIVVSIMTIFVLVLLNWRKDDFQYYRNLLVKIMRGE